ncbi:MAG: hypothetical protein ACTSQA_09150 [Candidatus Heimdallarchaeaceae archaeon]
MVNKEGFILPQDDERTNGQDIVMPNLKNFETLKSGNVSYNRIQTEVSEDPDQRLPTSRTMMETLKDEPDQHQSTDLDAYVPVFPNSRATVNAIQAIRNGKDSYVRSRDLLEGGSQQSTTDLLLSQILASVKENAVNPRLSAGIN